MDDPIKNFIEAVWITLGVLAVVAAWNFYVTAL